MISSETFKKYLDFAYTAYQENNITDQAYRQNGKVPYMTHPLGAAMLLIADTRIPYKERELGFKILLLHDIVEDTSLPLPDWVEQNVKNGVEEMTYSGPNELNEKIQWAQNKSTSIKLLMLYDSFWSLYERHVRGPIERQRAWTDNVTVLADDVEKHYGNIRIVQIARSVVNDTDWESSN